MRNSKFWGFFTTISSKLKKKKKKKKTLKFIFKQSMFVSLSTEKKAKTASLKVFKIMIFKN